MKFRNLFNTLLIMFVCGNCLADGLNPSPLPEEKGPKIKSLVLNDATMQETGRLLSNATGIPIIISPKAAAIQVDIFLQNSYCMDILQAICRSYGMYCRENKSTGIIYIQTIDELRDNIQLYNDESVEVVNLLYPKVEDIGDTLQQLFVDRVIWVRPDNDSGNIYDNIREALRRMELIAKKGTFDFSSSSGESSESSDDDDDNSNSTRSRKNVAGKTLSQIQGTSPKNTHQRNREIVSQLPEKKVLDAMKTAAAESKLAKTIEVTGEPGLIYIAALPQNNSLLLRSADIGALRQIKQLIDKLDKPSPQVLLEMKVLAVDVTDTNARAIDFLFGGKSVSGGFADGLPTVTSGGQSILSPSSTLIPQGTGIDTQAAIFNVISDNFRARIQMLEKDQRVTSLATPNLLVSDNEASKLFAGQEVTVMQKAERTLTYTNSSSGAQNPNISWNIDAPRRKIGISLVVTPKIHADRTVTIRLLQERSSLGDMRENVYSGGEQQSDDLLATDSDSSSTSESQYFLSQDIDMQSIATTVIGKDNNILVIGGLVQETADKQVQKLPWLSELPVFGELLFTRYEQVRKRSEILVIIRPYVLLAPGEGEQVSRTFMQKISLHPSARGDIPSLGLMTKKDIAKASRINPNDPWYKRVLQYLDVWKIDMDTAPEIENALKDYHERKDDIKSAGEIKKIEKEEKTAIKNELKEEKNNAKTD
ncbi:MAG: hypothetical protein PHV82_09450 [Victivallaceae bacterium]|nr:hypothetical protein [Victivallaceae bacterium]